MGYFIITFFSQFTHAPKIDAVQHIRACESAQAKKKNQRRIIRMQCSRWMVEAD